MDTASGRTGSRRRRRGRGAVFAMLSLSGVIWLWPSQAVATSCTPACECLIAGPHATQELTFPLDGSGGVPLNAQLFIVSSQGDASDVSLVEEDTGVPVEVVVEVDVDAAPPMIRIRPNNGLTANVTYRLSLAGAPETLSVFTAGPAVDNVPPTLRDPLYDSFGPPPCDESLYFGVAVYGQDDQSVALTGITVSGGGLAIPQRFFVTQIFGDQAYFELGRSLDGEGCLDNFALLEQGQTYDVVGTVYDTAGNASEASAPIELSPTYKAASPDSHRTCLAGCCVSSVAPGPGEWPGAVLFALLLAGFLGWRRTRAQGARR